MHLSEISGGSGKKGVANWPSRSDAQQAVVCLKLLDAPGWKPTLGQSQGRCADSSTFDSPFPIMAPEVDTLVAVLGGAHWQDNQYDPVAACSNLRDADVVARASLAELRAMITVFVRGERFCDGFWAAELKDGTI